jgi:hypothetical protein
MSELRILNGSGDTKIIWNSDKQAEVDVAERTFDELKKKGYSAFSVKKNGDKDKLITKFEADAEKIILIPPMSGG